MAVQITDIYKFDEGWAINVDFKKEEYRVCWVGSWREVPDLTTFPYIHGTTTTTRIPHSTAVRELWAKSSAVCYGGDSHIRLLDPRLQDAFSICKVAVHARQRQSIQDEFDLLHSFSIENAPVVSIHPDPLVDEDGIFGFKMEQLFKVEQKKWRDRLGDIYDAMTKIHDIGIVHNDFHPGNIMQRSNGTLIVIDFGRSGPVGYKIPPEKQSPLWKGPEFSFEADNIITGHFAIAGDPGADFYQSPNDPAFFVHHGMIDRTSIWQTQQLAERTLVIAGGTSMVDPDSRRQTLDDWVDLGVANVDGKAYRIRDLVSTVDGPFCYTYE